MIYALDTNIISFLLRPSKNPEVVRQFEAVIEQGDEYVIPPLSYYEISWHLLWKNAPVQSLVFDRLYTNSFSKVFMSERDFAIAAKIKADLVKMGTPIGENDADIFIAAHCLANGYTLVTDNVKDFERIDGLKLVNWKE
jgi:predicted nucleic acid-binding protein